MFFKKKKLDADRVFFIELPLDPLFPSRYHARTRAHTRKLTLTIARGGFCVVNNSASLCATHTHTHIYTNTHLVMQQQKNPGFTLRFLSDYRDIILHFSSSILSFCFFFNPMMRFKSMWGKKKQNQMFLLITFL